MDSVPGLMLEAAHSPGHFNWKSKYPHFMSFNICRSIEFILTILINYTIALIIDITLIITIVTIANIKHKSIKRIILILILILLCKGPCTDRYHNHWCRQKIHFQDICLSIRLVGTLQLKIFLNLYIFMFACILVFLYTWPPTEISGP